MFPGVLEWSVMIQNRYVAGRHGFAMIRTSASKALSSGRRGFTLIELLVVIAIIGLLASTVIASLGSARAKSRDARRLQDLKSIATQIELGRTGNNIYTLAGCTGDDSLVSSCTTPSFSQMHDPSGITTACAGNPTAVCDYSIGTNTGTAGATSDNYEVCTYLEIGSGGLGAGPVYIRNTTNGTPIEANCI